MQNRRETTGVPRLMLLTKDVICAIMLPDRVWETKIVFLCLKGKTFAMKKITVSLAAVLVLLLAMMPAACAERLVDQYSCVAGELINYYIGEAPVNSDVYSNDLPMGCILEESPSGDVKQISVSGRPMLAGVQDFFVNIRDFDGTLKTVSCSINASPATPDVQICQDVTCYPGYNVQLSVRASATDGGMLSYQWYAGVGFASVPIPNANSYTYIPDTTQLGGSYYYCVVTNTNNGYTTSATSDPVLVTVTNPTVKSIEIESMPAKTTYSVGDSLNTSGLQIKVNYDNGSWDVVNQGFTAEPSSFPSAGTQTVKISYQNCVCYFYVTVADKEASVEGIGVVTLPKKTEYKVGDKLETAGLSIRAYTADGHYDVSTGLDCSPTTMDTAGSQTITVKYAGKTCTFTVKVTEEKEVIKTITVASRPTKVEYTVGDKLYSSGLVLRVVTNKGTQELTSGFTCTPKQLNTAGTQEITVVYGQYTCTFNVTVKAKATPTPSQAPTPTPGVSPSAGPSSSPDVPASGSPAPDHRTDRNETNSVSTVVKVGLIVAILTLAGLAGCVYVLQHKGNVDFAALFKGRKSKSGDSGSRGKDGKHVRH